MLRPENIMSAGVTVACLSSDCTMCKGRGINVQRSEQNFKAFHTCYDWVGIMISKTLPMFVKRKRNGLIEERLFVSLSNFLGSSQ